MAEGFGSLHLFEGDRLEAWDFLEDAGIGSERIIAISFVDEAGIGVDGHVMVPVILVGLARGADAFVVADEGVVEDPVEERGGGVFLGDDIGVELGEFRILHRVGRLSDVHVVGQHA